MLLGRRKRVSLYGIVYKDTLTAWFPSTDPGAYLQSLEKVAEHPAKRILPAHHSLVIEPEILFACEIHSGGSKQKESFITAAELLTMAIGQYSYRPDTGLRKRLESFEVNA